CLASFVSLCFHYTGQFNSFDKVIYFGNLVAGLVAPTVFLHFCLVFPEPRSWFRGMARTILLYMPAALMFLVFVAFSSGAMKISVPLLDLRWMLDRVWMVAWTLPYLIGALVLSSEYNRTVDMVVRQQLKWLRNGAFCGILPFVLGAVPNSYMKMSVLSVVLIPLTLAYAIVRYRLMDVDIIFRRGYAYTLATLCVMAAFYAIVLSLGSMVMLITAFLFQPIRNWIQERLDRHFYRDRYDYRRTLVEFARELSSETDLATTLDIVGERLLETIGVKHLGFFLSQESPEGTVFRLEKAMGPK